MGILQFMKISGFADAYYSFEAVTWTKMNYEEDGVRASTLPYYSSQEWVSPTVCTFSDRTKNFPQEYFGHKGSRTQIVFVINFTLFLLVTYYLRMMKLFIWGWLLILMLLFDDTSVALYITIEKYIIYIYWMILCLYLLTRCLCEVLYEFVDVYSISNLYYF